MSKTLRVAVGVAALAGMMAGCGEVTSTGPGGSGNYVPAGPAIAAVGENGPDCSRPTGAGVTLDVVPNATNAAGGLGIVDGVPSPGLDPSAPPCFDDTTQTLTPPGALLQTLSFQIADGVVQAPSDGRVRIVTQWFVWTEPFKGTCSAEINVVVEVSETGMPTCAAQVVFGEFAYFPIYTYQP